MTKYTLDQFNYSIGTNSWSRVPRDPMTVGLMITQGASLSVASAAVAAGAFSLGTYLVGFAATTLVTGFLMSALMPKPTMPNMANSRSLQANVKEAAAPHEIVYGKVRKGGVITHMESTDDNRYLHVFIVLAGHEIEAVEGIYINDEEQTDNWTRSSGVVNGTTNTDKDWEGKIRIFAHLGNQTTASSTFESSSKKLSNTYHSESELSAVNGNFIGKGLAYLYIRMDYDQQVFEDGIPNFTAVIKGKKVQNTSGVAQTYPASANAALVIRDYLISEYGVDDDSTYIDATSFATAQTVCNTNSGSGLSNKFEVNGVLSTADDRLTNLEKLTACCGGALYWGSGKWKLKAANFTSSVQTLSLADLRGEVSIDTKHAIRDQFNAVQGTFIDKDQDFVTADYPIIDSSTYLTEDNNEKSVLDLSFPMVTNSVQAQRLAKLILNRHREQISFTARFGLNAFKLQVGDTVKFNDYNAGEDNYRYGFYSQTVSQQKTFEVMSWDLDNDSDGDLQVILTLRETSSTAYDWDADEATIVGNNTSLTDIYSGLGITQSTISANDVVSVATDGTVVTETEVSWTAATNAFITHYDVEFKRTSATVYKRVTTTETSINLGPLTVGQAYDIRVRSRTNRNTVGTFQDIANAHVVTGDSTAPSAPTARSPSVKTGGYRFVTIGWNPPSDDDLKGFKVYRATTNSKPTNEIAITSDTQYTDGGLSDATTYYYWIEAFDHTGNDSSSLSLGSVTTLAELTDGDPAVSKTLQYDDLQTSGGISSAGQWKITNSSSSTATSTGVSSWTTNVLSIHIHKSDDNAEQTDYLNTLEIGDYLVFTSNESGKTGTAVAKLTSAATVANNVYTIRVDTIRVTGELSSLATANGNDVYFGFSRAPQGNDGIGGVRGPGRWDIELTDSQFANVDQSSDGYSYVDQYFTSASIGIGDDPVDKDQAWFRKSSGEQAVWIYSESGDSWNFQEEVVHGDLIVEGTVTTSRLSANAITAEKLAVSANQSDIYNSDPTSSSSGTVKSTATGMFFNGTHNRIEIWENGKLRVLIGSTDYIPSNA